MELTLQVGDNENVKPKGMRVQISTQSRKRAPESVLPPFDSEKYTYTLVLDLDETLVHFEASERKFRLRPGCLSFLRGLSHPYYEIVVFTAAS